MPIAKRLPFVVGWLLINLVGGAAAGILETRLEFMGTLLLAGFPVALGQGFYLRHHLPHSWRWTLILFSGWPLAHLLYISSQPLLTPLVTWLSASPWLWEVFWINFVRLGFVLCLVGLAQWLIVLRSYPGSWQWPPLSLLGGALLGGAGATICRLGCDQLSSIGGSWLVGMVLGALGWVAYALCTAPLLQDLLRHTESRHATSAP